MEANWTWSIVIGVIYVLVIFSLKGFMKSRPAFNLRSVLVIWNASLAIFSIIGTLRMFREFIFTLQVYGFQFSTCNPAFYNGATGFWVMLFAFSKVYELGDTLFIVLRKQNLIFLHWYHHLVTLIYMFFSYKDYIAAARVGITMNFTVHALMYTYYGLRACRVRVPRSVNMAITSIQIIQMVIGVSVTTWQLFLIMGKAPCSQTWSNLIVSLVMYASYLLLFANFFYKSYIKQKRT